MGTWQPSQVELDQQIYGFGKEYLEQMEQREDLEQLGKQFIVHKVDKELFEEQMKDLTEYARHELQEDVKVMEKPKRRGSRRNKQVQIRTIWWDGLKK